LLSNVIRPERGEERISVLRLVEAYQARERRGAEDSSTSRISSEMRQKNIEGHQKVEGPLSLPFSSSGF
jgi:hypothetical protein